MSREDHGCRRRIELGGRWTFSWSRSESERRGRHRDPNDPGRPAPEPPKPKKEVVPDPPLVSVLHPKTCAETDADITGMEEFLEATPSALDALFFFKNKYGKFGMLTPLTSACKMLHIRCVEFLLNRGARVDIESEDQHAIAHAAMATKSLHARLEMSLPEISSKCETIVKMIIEKKGPSYKLYESDYRAYRDLVCMVAKGLDLYNVVKILLESNEIDFLSAQNKLYSLNGEPYTSNILCQISGNKNYDVRLMKLFILHGDSFENKEPIRVKRQNNYYEYTFLIYAFPYQIITSSESIETKIELLKIFHYFGGNLRAYLLNDKGGSETLLQCVENMPEHIRNEGVGTYVEQLMSNPVSLRQACRHSLWKSLRGKYWGFVTSQQYLPRDIMKFLLIEEV